MGHSLDRNQQARAGRNQQASWPGSSTLSNENDSHFDSTSVLLAPPSDPRLNPAGREPSDPRLKRGTLVLSLPDASRATLDSTERPSFPGRQHRLNGGTMVLALPDASALAFLFPLLTGTLRSGD
jgi:hypothetical protein